MSQRLRDHLSDPENIVHYLLWGGLFSLVAWNQGVSQAIKLVLVIFFLLSGWRVVFFALRMIKTKATTLKFGEWLAGLYFFGACVLWLFVKGVNREAFILVTPLITGLIISLAVWFSGTEARRKLEVMEKKILRDLKSAIRKCI